MRGIGESVEAGGQRGCQLPREKQIARPRIGVLDPEKNTFDLATGSGQDLGAAGGRLETAGARESLRRLRQRRADFGHVSLVTNQMGAASCEGSGRTSMENSLETVLSVAAAPRKPG